MLQKVLNLQVSPRIWNRKTTAYRIVIFLFVLLFSFFDMLSRAIVRYSADYDRINSIKSKK